MIFLQIIFVSFIPKENLQTFSPTLFKLKCEDFVMNFQVKNCSLNEKLNTIFIYNKDKIKKMWKNKKPVWERRILQFKWDGHIKLFK